MARLTVIDASILIAVIDSSDGWAADADHGREAEVVTGLRRVGIDELPMPAGTAPELARLRGATRRCGS